MPIKWFWYVLQMGIKFSKFVKKVVREFWIMGFGAPENGKNNLFSHFGVCTSIVKHRGCAFCTEN